MFPLVLLLVLFLHSAASHGNGTGCPSEPSCMKCGPKGCIKCPSLIVHPSRRCVTTCPYGHRAKWSTRLDYMGRMCVHNGNFLGLPSETATVLTGVFAGTVLCALLIGSATAYLRFRRKKFAQNIDNTSDLDDSPERRDFLKQLETLRPYRETYLDMLNDTRRQLRELYRNGDTHAPAAYKPILRDLARLLFLLNRQPDSTAPLPEDWEHLFNWAEKALKRYKRSSDVSQPQVAQLINFLQGAPVPRLEDDEEEVDAVSEVRHGTTMSTFKPDQVFGSGLSLQKGFTDSSTLNPQWKFEYALAKGPTSQFDPAIWKNSREFLNSSLFLDDDFCQLGFRPQDEITTEL